MRLLNTVTMGAMATAILLPLHGGSSAAAAPGVERDVALLSHVSLKKRMAARARVLRAGSKAVPALIEVLRGSQRDTYKRHAALYLLGEIGDPSASKALLRIAGNKRESMRQRFWAVSSLAKIGEERAVPLASSFLSSDQASLRGAAMQLILSRPAETSIPILLEGLRSDSRTMRAAAVKGLRKITGERKGFDADGDSENREVGAKRWEGWWEEKKAFPPEPRERSALEEHRLDGCVVWTDRGEERAKEIGEKVTILRKEFARWFGRKAGGMETRVREFQRWEDFEWYGSLNSWGFHVVSEFFYSPFLHEVVTYDTGRPGANDRWLIHEVFHDFYNRNTSIQLPWFNEGLAEYFETWTFEEGKLRKGPRNREWTERARAAFQAAPEGILSSLLAVTQEEFYYQGRGGNYALSWALVDHLEGTEEGREDLGRVFGLLRKSWASERIRKRVFGRKKLVRLERGLRKSLASSGKEESPLRSRRATPPPLRGALDSRRGKKSLDSDGPLHIIHGCKLLGRNH